MPIDSEREDHDAPGAVPQRNVVAWVLQGNPKLYDIDKYFARQTFVYWNCPQFAELMQIGMPVFFKRSGDGGGLIAYGKIAELPKPIAELSRPDFIGADLWTGNQEDDALKVGIELEDIRRTVEEGMIPTQKLERIEELAGHPLVAFRQGTVFRLSEGQAFGIYREWGQQPPLLGNIDLGVAEGARRLVRHYRIERSRQLIEDKKQAYRDEHGQLGCEVCRFHFSRFYPSDWVDRLIEAHHVRPLSELDQPCRTRLTDLVLVCRNCHGLIHRTADAEENLRLLRQHFGQREN